MPWSRTRTALMILPMVVALAGCGNDGGPAPRCHGIGDVAQWHIDATESWDYDTIATSDTFGFHHAADVSAQTTDTLIILDADHLRWRGFSTSGTGTVHDSIRSPGNVHSELNAAAAALNGGYGGLVVYADLSTCTVTASVSYDVDATHSSEGAVTELLGTIATGELTAVSASPSGGFSSGGIVDRPALLPAGGVLPPATGYLIPGGFADSTFGAGTHFAHLASISWVLSPLP